MASRRGAGEGTIRWDEQRKRWVGRLSFTDAAGRRQRPKFYGRTKIETQRKMREAKLAADAGLPRGRSSDTVDALMTDYLADGLPSTCRTAKTREGYEWAAQHIRPALGNRKLRALSPADVDRFLRGKAADGYSRGSLVQLHAVLKRALRWAEREGRVNRNVAALCDTPQGGRRLSKALTPDQATALVNAAHDDRLEALYLIGLTIPSRPGELTGLCWNNVDFDRGVIHFRQALHRSSSSELTLGPLKTQESRRSVEAPQVVMDALQRRRSAQASEQLIAGAVWSNPVDLVFTTEIGTPIDPANLRRSLRKLANKAGIPGQWTIYELRHSAVSILSAAGVPIELIADTAGHRNSHTTATIYRHNLSPVISSAKGPMDQLFGTPASANRSS